MIQWQRTQSHLFALFEEGLHPGFHLHHIGHEVAVGEHGAFRYAGGAARVLQQNHIVGIALKLRQTEFAPAFHRLREGNSVGQGKFGHHLFDGAHHEVDDGAFWETQHLADARQNDGFDLRLTEDFLQIGSKILSNDDCLGPGIIELMEHLAGRVERVGIDNDQTGPQCAEQCNGVLREVGHHQRNAVAGLQTSGMEVSAELRRELVHLGEGKRFAHTGKRGPVFEFFERLVQHSRERRVGICVNIGRYAFGVQREPWFFVCHNCLVLMYDIWLVDVLMCDVAAQSNTMLQRPTKLCKIR